MVLSGFKPVRWFRDIRTTLDRDQRSMSAKHFKKRRRKRDKQSDLTPSFIIMTPVTSVLYIFTISLLFSDQVASLTGDSRSLVRQYTNHDPFKTQDRPVLPGASHPASQSYDQYQGSKPNRYLLLRNKLDENQEKRDRLLRKLSSTILLENLIRKPPISTTGDAHAIRSPPLFLPHFTPTRGPPRPTRGQLATNVRRSDIQPDDEKPTLLMDVATTNLTGSISDTDQPNNEDAKLNATGDSFNQRSLNYLVDKLLSLSNPNQADSGVAPQPPRNRPPPRAKPAVQHVNSLRLPYLDMKLSSSASSKAPALTLDMLIKDEYDSRVQPMIESLKSQQNLSIASTTTRADPLNHRLDDVITSSEASTTTSLLGNQQQSTTPSLDVGSPLQSNTQTGNGTDEAELDEYEEAGDDDKSDPSSSTDDDDNQEEPDDSSNESTPKPKKILRNVPPYQLGSFTGRPAISSDSPPQENTVDNMQVRTTTTANSVASDPRDSSASNHKTASPRIGISEKSSEASTRGSLVFSDGANEAERSSRRKEQPSSRGNDTGRPGITPKNDKLGESFLLNQLFSTMNPLIDLNLKLNDQSVSLRDANRHRNSHPLIYKGYVGKDDYLLSTTSSDWSRPIGNSRENTTTNPYRHLPFPSIYSTTTTTTPVPPTEPPTVPYNYYLNQPVTNAQSVPPMFIPTTESTTELNSNMPTVTVAPTKMPRAATTTTRSPATDLNFENPSLTEPDENLSNRGANSLLANNRKYSYQIPNNKQSQSTVKISSQRFPSNNTRFQNSRNASSESDTQDIKSSNSKASQKGAGSKSGNSSTAGTSWSPTKVTQFEVTTMLPPTTQEIQRKHQGSRGNHTNFILVGGANSSPPMVFPVVETKDRSSGVMNHGEPSSASNSDANNAADVSASSAGEFGGRNTSDPTEPGDGFSHARSKFNAHRNKMKVPNGGDIDGANQLGDEQDDDRDARRPSIAGNRKTKRPTSGSSNSQQHPPDDGHALKEDSNNDYPSAGYGSKPARKTGRPKNRIQVLDDDGTDSALPEQRNETLQQQQQQHQVKKVNKFLNHEQAGSEISESSPELVGSGLGDGNQTNRFVHFHQPTRTTESIMVVGGNTALDTPGHPIDPYKIPVVAHPNPNFYSEASSERPVMDNSMSFFGGPLAPHRNNHHLDMARDPYQRTSSNTVLSTVQHPGSTTLAPSTSSGVPPSSSTTQVSTTAKDNQDEPSTKHSGDGPKAPNKSSDRLAFILIGGSCVLSVVCLVLAAMSMRCQDMCDDYQSLRNAEKAALKLQKHRLKYTKNHQINRLNHGLGSSESGQNLIDDFNNDNNRINSSSSADAELNQARNLRFQTNAKSIQFIDNALGKAHEPLWSQAANNNMQQPVAGVFNANNQHVHRLDADGVHQVCGCENCTDRRMLLHEDLVLSNKHLSWLHPYYQMQQQSRFRPLFGAGSGAGTFFPQTHAERSFRADSSVGAQALVDSSNAKSGAYRSCAMGRSKSFLLKGNNAQSRHTKSSHLDHSACGLTHVDCNNLDNGHAHHHHHQHICHNNHHEHSPHKCHHAASETTASDESEMTIDGGLCDNHAHCAREHSRDELNTRVKLIQMSKLNSQLSSGYKKQLAGQAKRVSHSHHNNHSHHYHHNHHQHHLTASSSDSSSLPQCTCTRDHQPLVGHGGRSHKSGHKHHVSKHDPRASTRQQAKRDKSMLIWSTNRDRLI